MIDLDETKGVGEWLWMLLIEKKEKNDGSGFMFDLIPQL